MKPFYILSMFIIIFTLSFCTNLETSTKDPEVAKANLLETIDVFNTAFKEGDVTTLESMITDNYVHTNGNSKSIGKKEWLSYLKTREDKIKSGNLEVVQYKMDEIKIELYENSAIVTGKIVVSNKEKGRVQKNEYRITNIWVNKSGNWKRAGFHDGKIE